MSQPRSDPTPQGVMPGTWPETVDNNSSSLLFPKPRNPPQPREPSARHRPTSDGPKHAWSKSKTHALSLSNSGKRLARRAMNEDRSMPKSSGTMAVASSSKKCYFIDIPSELRWRICEYMCPPGSQLVTCHIHDASSEDMDRLPSSENLGALMRSCKFLQHDLQPIVEASLRCYFFLRPSQLLLPSPIPHLDQVLILGRLQYFEFDIDFWNSADQRYARSLIVVVRAVLKGMNRGRTKTVREVRLVIQGHARVSRKVVLDLAEAFEMCPPTLVDVRPAESSGNAHGYSSEELKRVFCGEAR